MRASALRIVVTGSIAQYPLGGMTWHYLQYVLGLHRLGHDVFYLEDTGAPPYDPRVRSLVTNSRWNVEYLAGVMARVGLEQKWAYCDGDQQWAGLDDRRRMAVLRSADLLVNVSGMLHRPEAYRAVPRLAYIDTDPVFNQLRIARSDQRFRRLVDAHDVHFTFGERLAGGASTAGRHWHPTRQPIVLEEWQGPGPRPDVFSTIMNWRTRRDPSIHAERAYGEKDVEFLRFVDLPRLVAPAVLEIALNAGKDGRAPLGVLSSKGWRLVDPDEACVGPDRYRSYIHSSMAEWSIAKNGYVRGRPGWFSERSACYLAAGRPVVVQDTGFSSILPVGEGILPFATPEEAAAAISSVRSDYRRHSDAARSIADEYFDARKVLDRLVHDAVS